MAVREASALKHAIKTGYAGKNIVQVSFDMSQLTVEPDHEDLFANAGTHEMGAGVPPPGSSPNSKSSSEAEFEPVSACKSLYEVDNCKRLLMSMVIGLKSSDGRTLGDLSEEPYASMRQKAKFQPVAKDLKDEQNRRAVSFGLKAFKNQHYSKAKSQEWLEANPVTNKLDVEFLLATEKLIHEELNSEIEERREIELERNKANGVWNTPEPWMRLHHCLTDDRCRDALMMKDMVLDRAALDARNNEERPKTVWEEAAALHNDTCVVFHAKALPELHMFFSESKQLCFEDMPGGEITPEQVKSRCAQARAELIPASESEESLHSTARVVL